MRCQFKSRRCAGTATAIVTDTETGQQYGVCKTCLRRAIIDQRPVPGPTVPERHPGRM